MKPDEMLIKASTPDEILSHISGFYPSLDKLDRRRVSSVTLPIAMQSGNDELFRRYNGRTVADIIADSRDPDERLIDEGERDGISFRLYDTTEEPNG